MSLCLCGKFAAYEDFFPHINSPMLPLTLEYFSVNLTFSCGAYDDIYGNALNKRLQACVF